MNKENQSKTLRNLEYEKERLTKIVDDKERLLRVITDNGTVTKEELDNKLERSNKKSKHITIGILTTLPISIVMIIIAVFTLGKLTILPYISSASALLSLFSSLVLSQVNLHVNQKCNMLTKKIEHLKNTEKERENAKQMLEKVVEQIQALSTSDKELVALEEKQSKAQAMLEQFIEKNTSHTTQSKAEIETDEVEEENGLKDEE